MKWAWAAGAMAWMLLVPGTARAQVGLGAVDGWLSGEAGILAAILGEEVAQAASLVDTVTRLTEMVTTLNDVAASGREAVRIAQALASLDPERIAREVESEFLTAFPEAQLFRQEVDDLKANLDGLRAGGEAYWNVSTRGDGRVDALAQRTFSYGFRGSAYGLVRGFETPEPSQLELRLERQYRKAGLALKRASRSGAWSFFQKELGALRADAQETRNLEALVGANNAAANLQAAQALEALRDLEEMQVSASLRAEDEYGAWRSGLKRFVESPEGLSQLLAPAEVRR